MHPLFWNHCNKLSKLINQLHCISNCHYTEVHCVSSTSALFRSIGLLDQVQTDIAARLSADRRLTENIFQTVVRVTPVQRLTRLRSSLSSRWFPPIIPRARRVPLAGHWIQRAQRECGVGELGQWVNLRNSTSSQRARRCVCSVES